MLDKVVRDADEAVAEIKDGASLMVGGFGLSGHPIQLLAAVLRKGVKDLTVISNNAGVEDVGLGALILNSRVSRLICSFPTGKGMWAIKEQVKAGQVKVEVVPQGTLIERIRAGGAGLGGILTTTGLDTELTENKPVMEVDNCRYVLESALKADFGLVKAEMGDRWGNLFYRLAARNFNPSVAMAGQTTLAEVNTLVELGKIDPNYVHTPGAFVQKVTPINNQPNGK
jgi:3-oxoadipate CoA-transferase alpha subunit